MFENLFAKRGLSLDRLRVLVEVAEAGGISRAVDGDPVRQSQYSRQLRELEEFFGIELTRRQGKSLVLTPPGQRLALLARESFSGLGDFAAEHSARRVVFAVGGGESLLRWLLLPCAGDLRKHMPSAALSLHNLRTTDVIRHLQDLTIDFGIVRADAVTANLKSRPLGKVEYALFAPASASAGEAKPSLSPAACVRLLRTLPLACLAGKGEFSQGLDALMEAAGLDTGVQLRCESFPSLCRAVAIGQYAAVLPLIASSELATTNATVHRSAFFAPLSRQIALAWNPRIIRLRPFAERVRDWLAEKLKA